MKTMLKALQASKAISDYKINLRQKESFELFFVKGKLETVRTTDTCDRTVTVYVDHDGFRGDAQFYVYPSTTEAELNALIEEAARNARLICNAPYALPEGTRQEQVQALPGNLGNEDPRKLAQELAKATFEANTVPGGSLNSVEVFLNHYTGSVCNSRGLHKTQTWWTGMVEAIPTFNGPDQSVELYEQYNFSAYDREALMQEIAGKMTDVKARYEAKKPDFPLDCPVILHKLEMNDLITAFAQDLNYATVYSHGNLYHKGDRVQKDPVGDLLSLTMKGSVPGNVCSAGFDGDGLDLGEIRLIHEGVVENYYGSNRFGQYLGEKPTGALGCMCLKPGSVTEKDLAGKPWLEVISMSGLQVDFFNDYIGGEIRLAYYHDGDKALPVTGISVAGKLGQVLDHIRLSQDIAAYDGYCGPATAVLTHMHIF